MGSQASRAGWRLVATSAVALALSSASVWAQDRPGGTGPGPDGRGAFDRPARPDNAATGGVTAGDAVRPMGNEPVPLTRVPATDEGRVLAKLYRMGRMQAAAARLATEQGSTRAVRDWAARLVQDHRIAEQRLLEHATRLGVDVGNAAPENAGEAAEERAHVQAIEGLRKLSGRDFDQAFAREMQSSHLEALMLVTDARDRVKDRGLEAWLGDLLPVVRKHEQTATNIMAASADRPPIID